MTAAAVKRLVLYESGANSMPGPDKLRRRRGYWYLLAAWRGWPA